METKFVIRLGRDRCFGLIHMWLYVQLLVNVTLNLEESCPDIHKCDNNRYRISEVGAYQVIIIYKLEPKGPWVTSSVSR